VTTSPAPAAAFDAWALEAIQRGDLDTLASFRTLTPGMPYAHPTADHFLPLFIALGAVDGRTDKLIDGMDGYAVGFSRRSFALY
jgi:4,5-DOPA dioxygenase extradiol